MAKGNKKRKYRIRYDRIVIVVLVMIIIAVLVTSCTKFLFGKDEPEFSQINSESEIQTSSQTDIQTDKPSETTVSIDTGSIVNTNTTASHTSTTTQTTTVPVASDGYKTENYSYDEIYKGNLVLVNAEHEYKFLEDDIDTITVAGNRNDYYEVGDYVTELDKETLYQLNAMIKGYAESNGITDRTGIFVQYGYRTYDEQVDLHNSGKSKTFEAGHTDYHTGRTFDMFYYDSESATGFSYFSAEGKYEWFAENAGNYGFIVRYPEEKKFFTGENPRNYTYRYVGIPHAAYMNENNLCFEEYIELLKTYTIDNPLGISANGNIYSVYYVPAEKSDINEITVPSNKIYSVSGNNADGFIVTVTE